MQGFGNDKQAAPGTKVQVPAEMRAVEPEALAQHLAAQLAPTTPSQAEQAGDFDVRGNRNDNPITAEIAAAAMRANPKFYGFDKLMQHLGTQGFALNLHPVPEGIMVERPVKEELEPIPLGKLMHGKEFIPGGFIFSADYHPKTKLVPEKKFGFRTGLMLSDPGFPGQNRPLSSDVLRDALKAGCLGAGVELADIEIVPLPGDRVWFGQKTMDALCDRLMRNVKSPEDTKALNLNIGNFAVEFHKTCYQARKAEQAGGVGRV